MYVYQSLAFYGCKAATNIAQLSIAHTIDYLKLLQTKQILMHNDVNMYLKFAAQLEYNCRDIYHIMINK